MVYDYQLTFKADHKPSGNKNIYAQPPSPEWSRKLLGVDPFSLVRSAYPVFRTSGTGIVQSYTAPGKSRGFPDKSLSRHTSAEIQNAIVQLEKLPSLEQLSLWTLPINDAGLKSLAGLSRLRELNLGFTEITDAGLLHLRNLHQLEELDLRGTAVTDVGLEQLSGLTRLNLLDLRAAQTTPAGREKLRQALPNTALAPNP